MNVRPGTWLLLGSLTVAAVATAIVLSMHGSPKGNSDLKQNRSEGAATHLQETTSKRQSEPPAQRERERIESNAGVATSIDNTPTKPMRKAKQGILPDVRMVAESATRDLESAKQRPQESDFSFLKRLATLERRREKNRLVLQHVLDEEFILFKRTEKDWNRFKIKGFYNISVGSVSIDGEKWQVLVAIDPSKNLYYKDLTDYWIDLTRQSVNRNAIAFNRLTLPKRKEVMEAVFSCYAARSAMLKAESKAEKDKQFESYWNQRSKIDKRWLGLTFTRKTHTAQIWQ